MHKGDRGVNRGTAVFLCISSLLLLSIGLGASSAVAAEPPEFDPVLSLTGGCGTSKADPVPDPGCPDKKPPKPFTGPYAIAIDSFGYEYVASYGAEEGKQGRIDVFTPEGVFVTEIADPFGPKSVAVDSKGNLYVWEQVPGAETAVSRYAPTVYKPAEGKIEYGSRTVMREGGLPSTGGVAVDSSTDRLFVSGGLTISEYGSAEEGNSLIDTITHENLFSTNFAAVDATNRRLYASSCRDGIFECFVMVFDVDTHELLEEVDGPSESENFLSTKGWLSIAVDEDTGDFFVGDLELTSKIHQFDESYAFVSTLTMPSTLFEEGLLQIAISNAPEGVKNYRYLFVPSGKNRALAFSPQKEQTPIVVTVSTSGVGENEAELLATIKPRGGVTTYRFEYLTEQEYEEAGNSFTGAKVAGEGTIQPVEQEAEVSAVVKGLAPDTSYRFRVFAENLKGPAEGEEAFTTYDNAPVGGSCANESLRLGPSALLPDCRAFELVTPPDTNGRAPRGVRFVGDRFATVEASPGGEAVSFVTEGGTIPGLGGSGAFNGSPYRSTRTSTGWSTVNAGPMGSESSLPGTGSTSPDQGYLFWTAVGEGSAVVEGKDAHYIRYPDGHSELVGRGSIDSDPMAVGRRMTEGGAHIIFETIAGAPAVQLEPNAPPAGTQAVYDRIKNPVAPDGEETKVVSLLPGEVTPAAGENALYLGSSADGEGIAFRIAGILYLRVGNAETFEIGPGLTFAGVSAGGQRIFYLEGGDLKAFDTSSEEEVAFTATGDAVPVNVAEDGTRAYFVSPTAIAETGSNPSGEFPVGGQRNLYLSEEGAIRFVGTVTARDVEGESTSAGSIDGLGLWTMAVAEGKPSLDPSRLDAHGTVLLFSSRANLTEYDSEETPQIYRYDSVGNRLHCISCIPTKASATGGASLQSIAVLQENPEPFGTFGYIPNLRADGKHAVFQSTEALVARDSDEVQDVYEWEDQGVGSCTRAGGCVYLISSGQSEEDNYLYGVSASGNDIFFITSDVLVGGDDNTLSIYDARVNGGFPEAPAKECEGEGCRPGLTPPPPLAPAVTGSVGPSGNLLPPKRKPCPKGKRKVKRGGKVVCVKKKQGKKKKHRKGKAAGKGAGK